jgi:predicted O-linked N-acetylglucosamine transferase (SPINDLY family)
VLLKRAGRLRDAVPVLEAAKRLAPRNPSAWQNLGNVHAALGDAAAAAAAYQGGLKLAPRNAELWRLHGRALRDAGDAAGALTSLERAVALAPAEPNAVTDLVGLLLDRRDFSRAPEVVRKALAAGGDPLRFRVMEARIALRAGEREAARTALQAVLAEDPYHDQANFLLSRLHGDADRRAANAALRAGLAGHPGNVELMGELIESLTRSRYDDEAAHLQEAYELACQLLERDPGAVRGHAKALRSSFRRCLDPARVAQVGTLGELAPRWMAERQISALHDELGNVASLEDRIALVEWHRDWGRRVAAQAERLQPLAVPALDTGRRIRVGFLSSDLRHHPVSYFALPIFEHYDRERFELFCYSFYERERDQVQAAIEQRVDHFRWWPGISDEPAARRIAEDGLDMLFELGGTTAMNKVTVMAWRPARLGASWLGYPHSAGIEQIDYILTDPYIRPADPRLLIERPFEMPESWVVLGNLGFVPVPIEEALPEERQGALTFGTMNNPYKYTPSCLDAWAAVLRAVPGSRFLFVRPEGRVPAFVANARAAFAARDVDPDRLAFIGIRGDHLKHYNAIDIALDSFPHVGGTTTCETLWMGVPCVTLVGPGFPERLSYSNLNNAGLGDLCATTVGQYVEIAVALAADRARRRALRHGLRAQIRANPLGQQERWVRDFYAKVAEVVAQ